MTESPKTAIIVIFLGLEAGTTQSKPYNHIYTVQVTIVI